MSTNASNTRLRLASLAGHEVPATGAVPLTPIQRQFFEQERLNRNHFNQSLLLELTEGPDVQALSRALDELLAFHDALHMRFEQAGGQWQGHSAPAGPAAILDRRDLSGLDLAAQEAAMEAIADEVHAGLDIERGPLLAAVLFTRGDGSRPCLFLAAHHLVIDAVSWHILLDDLETAYGQAAAGNPVSLGPATTSYQDWARRLGVDLSRTVGWFTSIYPVALEVPEGADSDWRGLIKSVRRQLRAIPGHGIGFGALRYLGAPAVRDRLRLDTAGPQVAFNYLGQWDTQPAQSHGRLGQAVHGSLGQDHDFRLQRRGDRLPPAGPGDQRLGGRCGAGPRHGGRSPARRRAASRRAGGPVEPPTSMKSGRTCGRAACASGWTLRHRPDVARPARTFFRAGLREAGKETRMIKRGAMDGKAGGGPAGLWVVDEEQGGQPSACWQLFCFSHAGGGPSFFRPWSAALQPEIAVRRVLLPGREWRLDESSGRLRGGAPALRRPHQWSRLPDRVRAPGARTRR
jgi:hypothetical protein